MTAKEILRKVLDENCIGYPQGIEEMPFLEAMQEYSNQDYKDLKDDFYKTLVNIRKCYKDTNGMDRQGLMNSYRKIGREVKDAINKIKGDD